VYAVDMCVPAIASNDLWKEPDIPSMKGDGPQMTRSRTRTSLQHVEGWIEQQWKGIGMMVLASGILLHYRYDVLRLSRAPGHVPTVYVIGYQMSTSNYCLIETSLLRTLKPLHI